MYTDSLASFNCNGDSRIPSLRKTMSDRPHIVIIGAGFAGLRAARALAHSWVDVTIIDRSNHHLFQPLLYQVATAGLSPADIAAPIRSIVKHQENTDVVLGEVVGVDKGERLVILEDRTVPYDILIVATGARYNYFGHPDWEEVAPGLKSVEDATSIRAKILMAFEIAEIETDEHKRRALMTFAIVGAGPTGVELAGSIAELAQKALARDFRHINPADAKIVLLEAGPRILAAFPEPLAASAAERLERMGVDVRLGAQVQSVDRGGVIINGERLEAHTVLWAAGIVASPAGRWLGGDVDRAQRVIVDPDLTLAGHPEVFVVGDTASVAGPDGKPLPGVAPVAMQQGIYVAELIKSRLRGEPYPPRFVYHDKGNLATVGRSFAVADFGGFVLDGFLAWLLWLVVHIFYLIGFRNRVLVIIQWFWAYVTFQRGARLITKGPGG